MDGVRFVFYRNTDLGYRYIFNCLASPLSPHVSGIQPSGKSVHLLCTSFPGSIFGLNLFGRLADLMWSNDYS